MQDLNQGLWNRISSRLNAHWQTDGAIEDQAKNSTARPYYQRAFSPLDPTAIWLSHLALAIYMFVVNFDALAQASDFHPASARYASGSSIWGIKGLCKFVIYLIFYQTGRKNPGLTHFATLWRVCVSISLSDSILTHPPWKNGHHLEDDILKRIFPNENFYILSVISLKFVQRVLV